MNSDEVLEHVKKHYEKDLKDNQSGLEAFFPTMNLLNGRIGIPVSIRYKHKAKTGRVTEKKEEVSFYPTYDPFTGEKFKQD